MIVEIDYQSIKDDANYQAFLAKLRETPRNWYFYTVHKVIRLDHIASTNKPIRCCPITACVLPRLEAGYWYSSSKRLFLRESIALFIAFYSDNCSQQHSVPEVRQDLLRACGLL